MDQRESASPQREPNSRQNQRQGFGAVANLVAALLDDVTVGKPASDQPAKPETATARLQPRVEPLRFADNLPLGENVPLDGREKTQPESAPSVHYLNGGNITGGSINGGSINGEAINSTPDASQLLGNSHPSATASYSQGLPLPSRNGHSPISSESEVSDSPSRLPQDSQAEPRRWQSPSIQSAQTIFPILEPASSEQAKPKEDPVPFRIDSVIADLATASFAEDKSLAEHSGRKEFQASNLSDATVAQNLDVEPSDPSVEVAETEPYQGDGMAINIKGRADGVIVEMGRGNWELLLGALRNRLTQAGGFFRGGNVALDLADRSLQESDLHLICDLLVSFGMKPALVRTSSDRTFQSALMLGLAGTLESKEGRPLETVQAASSNQDAQSHYVYRGALRSGQVLKRRSHVLIVGDVNAGAEVVATGDILVWGRLRGTAHAGADGDQRSVVAAFDIDPVQLRIADVVAVGGSTQPEGYRWGWARNTEKRPEVARLVNGQIVIEPWDEAKSGGAPVLKKRR